MARVIVFQYRFADLVRAGKKTQTIRKTARCKPGDQLSLRRWSGRPYRSEQEILRSAVCKTVRYISIGYKPGKWGISVLGVELSESKREAMARADGFESEREMLAWFDKTHGLPFYGELIEWTDA